MAKKKRKWTPNLTHIANKLRTMLKAKIKELALVDTGALYDSIDVVVEDGSFKILAEDYYIYLDEGTEKMAPFNITESVINSREFQTYVQNALIDDIIYEIDSI